MKCDRWKADMMDIITNNWKPVVLYPRPRKDIENTENTSMAHKGNKTTSATTSTKKTETKSEAFYRLANQRTSKAIKAMNLVAGLMSSAYESTPESRKAIVLALETTVLHVKEIFEGKSKASDTFKLPV